MRLSAETIGKLLLKTVRMAVVVVVFVFGFALLLNLFPEKGTLSKYIVHPSMILAVWVCAYIFDRISLKELGLTSLLNKYGQLLLGGLLALGSTILMGAGMILTGEIVPANHEIIQIGSSAILETLLYCILIGVAEELLFRGYFISLWRKYGSTPSGSIGSALLFSLLHVLNPSYTSLAFLAAFALGLLYGYMFLVTGKLWMSIGHHIIWNFSQMLFRPSEGGELLALIIVAASFLVIVRRPISRRPLVRPS